MAHELLVKVPRLVPDELGFGVTHKPGDEAANLVGSFDIEPFTGYACARVIYGTPLGWGAATGFITTSWLYADQGGTRSYLPAQTYTGTGSWSRLSDWLEAGQGFLFGFIPYNSYGAFSLGFGRYSIDVAEGAVWLYQDGVLLAQGDLWSRDEWQQGPCWLQVYCVGERLCVRRWRGQQGISSRIVGSGDAIAAVPLNLSGTGPLSFLALPETHDTDFWFEHAPIQLLRAVSTVPTTGVLALKRSWDAVTLSVLDEAGLPLLVGPYSAFGYRVDVSMPIATGPNVYVAATRVRFAPTWQTAGAAAIDATDDILGENGVTERLSFDPGQTRVNFTLVGERGDWWSYRQANWLGRWSPDGEQRVEFFGGDPEIEDEGQRSLLHVTGEGPWRRLRDLPWTGGRSYAGWTLRAAYADVLFAAEGLILRLAGEELELPAVWGNYFSRNTSPSDFDPETPTWETILAAIEPSTERLLGELDRLDPEQRLPTPYRPASAPLVIETRGEALALATWHEALHIGQMMTYRNLLGVHP